MGSLLLLIGAVFLFYILAFWTECSNWLRGSVSAGRLFILCCFGFRRNCAQIYATRLPCVIIFITVLLNWVLLFGVWGERGASRLVGRCLGGLRFQPSEI